LFPFLTRTFVFQGRLCKDFETAYGYGGPIYNCEDEEFITTALTALKTYCSDNEYVAGFVRFHPLLQNQKFFDVIGSVIIDRKTVAIDLSQTTDEVWKNEIHSKNRNVIRKAEKAARKTQREEEKAARKAQRDEEKAALQAEKDARRAARQAEKEAKKAAKAAQKAAQEGQ
jgi:hypothetical protein